MVMDMEVNIEDFNREQSVKWMHLPHANTSDLVDELAKREGVTRMKLENGQRFEFHGPGELLFVTSAGGASASGGRGRSA